MTDMMHIGELAERSGLSLRTLRHYDEIGLVSASGRSDGGFRQYTEADFERLMLIRRMKPLGFSLEEMSELLHLVDAQGSDPDRSNRLARFIADTENRRTGLERQLARADEFLGLLRQRAAPMPPAD